MGSFLLLAADGHMPISITSRASKEPGCHRSMLVQAPCAYLCSSQDTAIVLFPPAKLGLEADKSCMWLTNQNAKFCSSLVCVLHRT